MKNKLPIIGNTTRDENEKELEVFRVFRNKANVIVVEYSDRNNLRGCVLPEYWHKKDYDMWQRIIKRLDDERLDRQAGF